MPLYPMSVEMSYRYGKELSPWMRTKCHNQLLSGCSEGHTGPH